MSSEVFNSVEGTFWVLAAFLLLRLGLRGTKRYRNVSLFSALMLFLFGVSDWLQVWFGSFLVAGMEWLLIWKVLNLLAIITAIFWYVKVRHA